MRIYGFIFVFALTFTNAQSIFELNTRLGRGLNFGNALEAPFEGEWGMRLEPEYFVLVKEAGFTSIRLPVSWTHHTAKEAPYAIDSEFMDRVQWAVDEALSQGLNIILNNHHHDELNADPPAEAARFEAIWLQIAERFKAYPDTLYFELLNEPHARFNQEPELWNQLLATTLERVRESNANRAVIVGPVNYNAIGSLDKLELPDDPNLIVTVHFYDPFAFTHQGAEWVTPIPPTGVIWTGGNRRLSPRWQNQSQDTELRFVKEGLNEYLEISFNSAEAFVQLHSIIGPRGYDELHIRANSSLELSVSCYLESEHMVPLSLPAAETFIIPLAECGNPLAVKDLLLKNNMGKAHSFLIETLELRGDRGVNSVFQDQGSELQERLSDAYDWGQQHGRPIFLGEFGAYSKADHESRLRWTRFMRQEIEKLEFSWAYWEFGAGFGVYDREAKAWRQDLLDSLMR